MTERNGELPYYRAEDDPAVVAYQTAKRYSVGFSRKVCEVQITSLSDGRKRIRELFNPSTVKAKQGEEELSLQTI